MLGLPAGPATPTNSFGDVEQLMAMLESLPPDSPRRALIQSKIDELTQRAPGGTMGKPLVPPSAPGPAPAPSPMPATNAGPAAVPPVPAPMGMRTMGGGAAAPGGPASMQALKKRMV
jgi:hypothetical protein